MSLFQSIIAGWFCLRVSPEITDKVLDSWKWMLRIGLEAPTSAVSHLMAVGMDGSSVLL